MLFHCFSGISYGICYGIYFKLVTLLYSLGVADLNLRDISHCVNGKPQNMIDSNIKYSEII